MRRLYRWGIAAALAVVACWLAPRAAMAQRARIPFSDEAVEKAIAKAVANTWSSYDEKIGGWEGPEGYPGGHCALACLSLLSAGESWQSPKMKRALEYLAAQEVDKTYVLGLRAQVWSKLPREHPQARLLLAKDAKQLMESIARPAASRDIMASLKTNPGYGSHGYVSAGKPAGGDHSNTQFGILGVWAAASVNLEIPKGYWMLVYKHYEVTQNGDGGWSYGGHTFGGNPGGSTPAMTCAGLASSFVAFDNLFNEEFAKCGKNPVVPTFQKGLDWLDKNYTPGGGYYGYAVERVGLASGYKYFGDKDWYKLGAMQLVNSQHGNGGWGGIVNDSFNLLFLVRGRAPVLYNRLEYEGDWNNRPRALANLSRWVSGKFEKEVNWQIISFKAPVEDWHDAPAVLISGSKSPKFSEEQLEKLRTYVWQGGMLLSVTECGGMAFDKGMREVYGKLFPAYELRELPAAHPIYSAHFPLTRPSRLYGLYNGIRLLAVHCGEDLVLPWQMNNYATGDNQFKLGFNVAYYTTDKASLRHRGTSNWPESKAVVPLRVVTVSRVKHGGNWDPEPLAWTRFGMLLGQQYQTKLVLGEAVGAEGLDASSARVAVLTGTGSLSLSGSEKSALKRYVSEGGTLVLEAAGGSESFYDSASALLKELYPESPLKRLATFSGLYQLEGMAIEKVQFRRAAAERVGSARYPRLQAVMVGERPGVLLSAEDLTGGLLGVPAYGCVGYAPDSAVELMRNIVIYGNQVQKTQAKLNLPAADG